MAGVSPETSVDWLGQKHAEPAPSTHHHGEALPGRPHERQQPVADRLQHEAGCKRRPRTKPGCGTGVGVGEPNVDEELVAWPAPS